MAAQSFAEVLDASTRRCREMDAPLAQRLQALADDVRSLNPKFAESVDRLISRLQSDRVGEGAPGPGDPLPSFMLPDQDGSLVSLDRLLDNGPVVISFHRGHWCPYCRINADALAKLQPEVSARGGQIVAITPELEEFTSELRSDAKARFPVLTDLDNSYAAELGLAFQIDEERRKAMTSAGWDIAPYQGNSGWMLPIPATFVVGSDARIAARFVDPDYRKRMDVEEILAALKQRRH